MVNKIKLLEIHSTMLLEANKNLIVNVKDFLIDLLITPNMQ